MLPRGCLRGIFRTPFSPQTWNNGTAAWNSSVERNTEVKRLLRPGIADGPETLAQNMTRAGAIAVNLVPLSSEEVTVLGDGLKRAKGMTVIRLKCEQRGGGGTQSRAELAVSRSVRARQLAALKMVESSALANERVCRKLGVAVGVQLKHTRTLMELEIGSNLGPMAMDAIGKALGSNVSLVRLSFADSNMGDASFGKLVNGLRNNTNIREINLSGCGLTDASGHAIGSILRAHASRRATANWQDNLRCYPGSAASQDLAKRQAEIAALGVGGLQALNLSYNNFTIVTVRSLCASMHQDTRLMVLRMKGNKINEEAAAKLGQAMKEHPRLVSIELQNTQVAGVDLGVLRVVPGSEIEVPHPEVQGGTIVKKEVFMDMDVPPTTPRALKKAAEDAAAAADAANSSRPKTAPASSTKAAATKTAAGSAGWYEGRRGWSPASGTTAPKWKHMGDHANAGRVPLSKAVVPNVGARPASAGAAPVAKKKKVLKKKKAVPREAPPPWGAPQRPKSAAERRSVLSPSAKGNADTDGSAQNKALVAQLTKALSTLEGRVASLGAEDLREQVALAARAAATASKLSSLGGRTSSALAQKVNQDLQALERICH